MTEQADRPRYRPDGLLPVGWAVLLFTLTAIVMVGHEAEHVVQIYQKWSGSPCPFECRGLMGNVLDVEWVHWVYNISTFLTLVISWLGLKMWRPEVRLARPVPWWSLTIGIFVVQGYHVMEHSAKIGQWLINGHHSPTPGILGNLLPPPTPDSFSLIEMHFAINTIVFVMVAIGYLGFQVWKLVGPSLRLDLSTLPRKIMLGLVALLLAGAAFWGSNQLLHVDHEHPQDSEPGLSPGAASSSKSR